MPIRTVNVFRFHCPACGEVTTVKCSKPVQFGDREWKRLVARAKVTPGVRSPSEFVRLALDRALSRPPQRLIALQRTKTPSKRH